MRRKRQTRVLMLGWEYPPRFAGGLGKACQGLAQAMSRQGVQIYFVLPTFEERISTPSLEVVGAKEVMVEAGWEMTEAGAFTRNVSTLSEMSAESSEPVPSGEQLGKITKIQSSAVLHPYSQAPGGPLPERIYKFLQQEEIAVGGTIWRRKPPELQTVREVSQVLGQTQTRKVGAAEIYGKNLWNEIEKFCFTVRHLSEAHEVDLVHAHDWMTFPAAFEFQKVTGVPVFLHVHATEYDRSGENMNNDVFRIEREGFRRANHIFAVSKYTAGIIERLYGVNKKKISVAYNAPEDNVSPLTPVARAKREPQVVFLGRLTFQKGPDHFLRAAELVARAYKKAKFVFCGTGDMMDQLRRQTNDLGIENRVHFAGFVEPAGVDQILQRSKVLVMPSVSEPFGLVALEAIRNGVPVIISKQSGVKEVLHRALQVDFWDHEKLADQILAALRLPDLSRQLVNEGMDQIQELNWEKSAKHVIHQYQKQIVSTFAMSIRGAHGH